MKLREALRRAKSPLWIFAAIFIALFLIYRVGCATLWESAAAVSITDEAEDLIKTGASPVLRSVGLHGQVLYRGNPG